MGGWVRKKKVNAILNSVEVKVEVGVELGKKIIRFRTPCRIMLNVMEIF